MKGSIMFKTLFRAISVASESLFLCKNLQMDLCGEKTCLRGFANKTGAYAQSDQGICYSLCGKDHNM